MAEKLLSYAAIILLIASFSFTDPDREKVEVGLSTTLLMARVVPLALVTIFCFLSVPVRRYVQLVKAFGRPPGLFWTWYAGVTLVSGYVSGITPTWSAWKCVEIFVVVLWASSVFVHVQRTESTRVMERIFAALVVACYCISLWSITEMFREGETIRDYVLRGYRLDTTWPHINSITLSVISLFAICGGVLLTNRMGLPTRVALLLPILLVFGMSRSRTGLLALFALAVFSMKTSTISKGKKLSFVALSLFVVGVLASSATIRDRMRLNSWEELTRGAGRIRSESGGSGWGDTVRLIAKNPAIGIGFVIVKRFLDSDHLAVDNFILQSLVVGGVIGAGPMIFYGLYAFLRWLVRVRFLDADFKRLAEMGLLATCLGFVKSFTTNGMSTYDISLILFLFGALSLRLVTVDAQQLMKVDETEAPELVGAN